jgi:hypothetical protein
MHAFASHEPYLVDNYWDDVPVKVRMEVINQVQEALVERGMPTMGEELILTKLRKRANAQRMKNTQGRAPSSAPGEVPGPRQDS